MKKLLTLALLFVCLLATEAGAQVTVIKAGRLVDPETGTAARDQLVVVEAGKVTAVGAGLAIPAGAQRTARSSGPSSKSSRRSGRV